MVDVDQQLLDKTGNSLGIVYTVSHKIFEQYFLRILRIDHIHKYFGLIIIHVQNNDVIQRWWSVQKIRRPCVDRRSVIINTLKHSWVSEVIDL